MTHCDCQCHFLPLLFPHLAQICRMAHKVIMILLILFAKVGLPRHHPHWVGGARDQDGGKGRRNQRGGRINTETGHKSACLKLARISYNPLFAR